MKFPSIQEVAKALLGEKQGTDWSDIEERYLDVRLQVYDDESWYIHTGNAQYDTDHRGFWGAGTLSPRTNCRQLAAELIEEAREHHAQCQPDSTAITKPATNQWPEDENKAHAEAIEAQIEGDFYRN